MKIAFFFTSDGWPAGFSQYREDGVYPSFQWDWDFEFSGEERYHVIDVAECRTWNDAYRHRNMLAGWDPDENVRFPDTDLETGEEI